MVPMLQLQDPLVDDSRLLGSYVMLFWFVPTFRRTLLSPEFYLKGSEVAEWKNTCRLYTKTGSNFFSSQFNPLKTKRRLLYIKTQSVPRCKHFSSRL